MNADATRNPLAVAWRWSIHYSPIMLAVRGVSERVRRHRHAAAMIARTDLPAPVRERIGQIVRRTRLHATEQVEVARELLAHALDARADAKGENEILASLGDSRAVGRLIRRAVKRKRPLVYQLRRWAMRTLLAAFAVVFVFYLVLATRFYMGSPSIKTDYFAKLNAPIHAMPEGDKAWPVYLDAMMEWSRVEKRLRETSVADPNAEDWTVRGPGVDFLYSVPKHHPDYEATVAALKAYRPTLDRVADATRRPSFGALYSYRTRSVEIEGVGRSTEVTVEPDPDPRDQQPLLFGIMPHLGKSRQIARIFAFDIEVAMDDADADRIVVDTRALLGLSRQLSKEPGLISSLVGVAIYRLAMNRLATVIDETPDLLSHDQLVILSHDIAAGRDSTVTLDFDSERMVFADLLQRTFTDDGHGGGRLTPAGARMISELTEPPIDFGTIPEHGDLWVSRSAGSLVMPIVGATVRGRAEQSRMHAEMIAAAECCVASGPSSISDILEPVQHRLDALDREPMSWYPLAQILPAIANAVNTVFATRSSADATLALLAATAYRQDHARWPTTLDELVPTYLPSVPDDPFAPDSRLRYRLDEDGPTLWYAGPDGDDDDGRRPASDATQKLRRISDVRARYDATAPEHLPDGDWVVFPPED
ncbi:MAG: hypothetical protein R3B57_08890 [Phycisphaerales bacterium]